MKKLLTAVLILVGLSITSYSQTDQNMNKNQSNGKVLVAYFSATGTTEKVAQMIAATTGGELFEITPEVPYTEADLDWRDKTSRSTIEMNDPKSRPAISKKVENIADYDVVYVGFPIWWYVAPTIINTFIESCDLSGKTVIPFATSGGSTIENCVKELRATYPNINWQDGKLLNNATEQTIGEWTSEM